MGTFMRRENPFSKGHYTMTKKSRNPIVSICYYLYYVGIKYRGGNVEPWFIRFFHRGPLTKSRGAYREISRIPVGYHALDSFSILK